MNWMDFMMRILLAVLLGFLIGPARRWKFPAAAWFCFGPDILIWVMKSVRLLRPMKKICRFIP